MTRRLTGCFIAVLAACGPAPTEPSLSLAGRDMELTAGQRRTLPLASATTVEWTSRDTSVARVSGLDAVAMQDGLTYLVARAGHAVDSIRMVVRQPIEKGTVRIRIADDAGVVAAGADGMIWRVPTAAGFAIGTPTPASFSLSLPGIPDEGESMALPSRVHIGGTRSQIIRTGTPDVGIVVRVARNEAHHFVAARPFMVRIDAIAVPAGTQTGFVRGFVSFDAAGIRQVTDSLGMNTITPLSDRLTRVFVQFNVPLTEYIVPLDR